MSLCQDAACPTPLPPDLQIEQTGPSETDRVGSKETEASSKGDYKKKERKEKIYIFIYLHKIPKLNVNFSILGPKNAKNKLMNIFVILLEIYVLQCSLVFRIQKSR